MAGNSSGLMRSIVFLDRAPMVLWRLNHHRERTRIMANDFSVYGPHEVAIQTMVEKIDQAAVAHNALIGQLQVKEGEVSEDDLNNARELNPRNDADIAKRNEQIEKIQARLDVLLAETNELARQDVPKPLEGEEKAKVQTQVKELQDAYKKMNAGIEGFGTMLEIDLDKLEIKPLVHMSGRKTSGVGTPAQSGPKIRTSDVYVNGIRAEVKKQGGEEGETSSTFSAAAAYILKNYKVKVAAADMHTPYFAAAGTTNSDDLPNDVEFDFPIKDDKGVENVLRIRAVRA